MTSQPRQLPLPPDAVRDLVDGDLLLMADMERRTAVGLITAQLPSQESAEDAKGLADRGIPVLYLSDFHMINLLTGRSVTFTHSSGVSYLIVPNGVEEWTDDDDQD